MKVRSNSYYVGLSIGPFLHAPPEEIPKEGGFRLRNHDRQQKRFASILPI